MENSLAFAQMMDKKFALDTLQEAYVFPQHLQKKAIYFLGNSLGLPAHNAHKAVEMINAQWAAHGVEGFFEAQPPWWDLEQQAAQELLPWVGAQDTEVAVLNSLTVNLHFLLLHFYKPSQKRFKIIVEEKAFPSDQYMIKSQLEFHGISPEDALIEIPRRGTCWDTQDFLDQIAAVGDQLALVFLGGVNYYNGQLFELEKITAAAHKVGAIAGYDLAHAVGNVPLQLHDWGVDFAAWCSYKYLNGGPGSIGGIFIHKKHLDQKGPTLKGWWGVPKEKRFLMEPKYEGAQHAASWHQSTPSIFALAPLCAALQLRNKMAPHAFFDRQKMLTTFLEKVLLEILEQRGSKFSIITPKLRGAQLTLIFNKEGRRIFDDLQRQGVYVDWREPDAIRLAPTAQYNTFSEVYRFGEILAEALS